METVIKPNFQISIPFEVIKELKLSVNDKVDLNMVDGKIIISKKNNYKKASLMDFRGVIKVGHGSIENDIGEMRKIRAKEIIDLSNE